MLHSHTWAHLSGQQLGGFAEHLVVMRFAQLGMQVFRSDVDDRGIDLVVRKDPTSPGGLASYWDVQVKSLRIGPRKGGYAFMRKSIFDLRRNLLLALVLFVEGEAPHAFLIPAKRWKKPDKMFCDRDYGQDGQTSKPEYGLQVSLKTMPGLSVFQFEHIAGELYA
jgi:hypothetical protein